LIPCYSNGIVLDLIDIVHSFLQGMSKFVPIYFLSAVGEGVLSYVNIVPEW